jgi:hypothetical protein
MHDNNLLFKCTSVKLKDYLLKKGLEYFDIGINKKGLTYWAFAETPSFKKAIKNWKK